VSPAPRITLSCSTRGRGHKITIACTAKGPDANAGPTALRFRVLKAGKVLATASTRLSHRRAKVTLRSRRAVTKGRYTLRIAISHAGGVAGVTRTIRLR
jgi:phospholipase C